MIIQQYLAYFFGYSLMGWFLESIYKTSINKKVTNSGFLRGPYCPIYGGGMYVIFLWKWFLEKVVKIRKKFFTYAFFVGSPILLSILEYYVSIVLEKLFNKKYWNYKKNKFNIKGRICLSKTLEWGILLFGVMKLIQPRVHNLIKGKDKKIINNVVLVIGITFVIECIFTVRKKI